MKAQLAIISLLTAASQLAALFKLRYTAQLFGVGSELDGYNLALVMPTFISAVISGVLQTGLFPVRARLHAHESGETLAQFERSVFWGIAALGVLISLLLATSASLLVPMIAGSASRSVQTSFLFAFRFTALLVALNIVGDCAGYMLAMRDRFAFAAGAPVLNGIFGGLMLMAWPQGGLLNLTLSTVIGVGLQIAVCLFGLRSTGFRVIGPMPQWKAMTARFLEVIGMGAWILPGAFLSNLIVSLPPVWIAPYGEGAVSAFGYAYRMHTSALQLLVMAGSTVILAKFSELVARSETAAINKMLNRAASASFLIGGLAILAVWTLGAPVLQWLFGGRFDAHAAERVAGHWWWMTLGLGFSILGNVYAKFWQAQGRPRLLSFLSALSLLTLTTSYWLLKGILHEHAPAAALSVSALVVVIYGQFLLRSQRQKSGRASLRPAEKTGAAD